MGSHYSGIGTKHHSIMRKLSGHGMQIKRKEHLRQYMHIKNTNISQIWVPCTKIDTINMELVMHEAKYTAYHFITDDNSARSRQI